MAFDATKGFIQSLYAERTKSSQEGRETQISISLTYDILTYDMDFSSF